MSTLHNDLFGDFGDDIDLANRQCAEEYFEQIVPRIESFQKRVSASGAGEWLRDITQPPQYLTPTRVEDGRMAVVVHTSPVRGQPMPIETIIQIGNRIFPPLGFSRAQRSGFGVGDIERAVWVDERSGGYVWATVKADSHTGITASSAPLLPREQTGHEG